MSACQRDHQNEESDSHNNLVPQESETIRLMVYHKPVTAQFGSCLQKQSLSNPYKPVSINIYIVSTRMYPSLKHLYDFIIPGFMLVLRNNNQPHSVEVHAGNLRHRAGSQEMWIKKNKKTKQICWAWICRSWHSQTEQSFLGAETPSTVHHQAGRLKITL